MVDTSQHRDLPLSQIRSPPSLTEERSYENGKPQLPSAKRIQHGLDVEKQILSPPVEAELFFLTSLFIELIDVPSGFTSEGWVCLQVPEKREGNYWSALADDFRTFLLRADSSELALSVV